MTIRQINIFLQITAAALATAALFFLLAGLIIPLDLPDAPAGTAAPSAVKARTPRLPPVDSYMPIFARMLQPSLAPAATAEQGQVDAKAAESATVAGQLALVGTIGNSVALIRGPDGTVGMVETGDDVNGSAVVAIRSSECDLRVNGKITTLRVSPPADDGIIVPAR